MTLSDFSDLTILLADDHPAFRKGLKSILRRLGFDGEILEANHGHEVLGLCREYPVDLFVLDYSMPILNGYDTSKIILKMNSKARIAIMSMFNEPELLAGFYQIGVQGYLDKNSDIDQIETAFLSLLNGQRIPEPLDTESDISLNNVAVRFTKREKELIELLAKGFTTLDISEKLYLTPKTVETYRCRLLDKTSVKNTTELLDFVHRNGII